MKYVGIDWAMEFHDVCIVEEKGNLCDEFRVEHTVEGLGKLMTALKGCEDGVEVGVEAHSGLLVTFLLEQGVKVYLLNPKSVDRYRDRYTVSGAKDDRRDAYVIAQAIRTDSFRMKPLKANSEVTQEMREMSRDRIFLVEARVSLMNRLRETLNKYYPSALEVYRDLSHPFMLEFLKRWDAPEKAKTAGIGQLSQLIRKHGLRKSDPKELHQMLNRSNLKASIGVEKACVRMTMSLVNQIEGLNKEIDGHEKRLDELLEQHPRAELIQSLPGIGSILAPRLIGEIGDDLSLYENDYNILGSYGGVVPITKRSGKKKSCVDVRRACNGYLRDALILWSKSLIRDCPKTNLYYKELRKRGCTYGGALRVIANRWLMTLVQMLKTNLMFDEELFKKRTFGLNANLLAQLDTVSLKKKKRPAKTVSKAA